MKKERAEVITAKGSPTVCQQNPPVTRKRLRSKLLGELMMEGGARVRSEKGEKKRDSKPPRGNGMLSRNALSNLRGGGKVDGIVKKLTIWRFETGWAEIFLWRDGFVGGGSGGLDKRRRSGRHTLRKQEIESSPIRTKKGGDKGEGDVK